ncbi:glypican-like protein [Dermatophagoides farinae]|uniref:Glypican-like protein n=1 Tax=Dermatophagoides farinae TaxID=6954 RepID=A0A9D4P0E5_DERFA|nr:glypican-like protein [Dermatophagoides farinae]
MSHADFHRMFSDTYGILYDRHSFIFNNMFHNLEQYYNDGQLDLTMAMKEFFNLLYKKMFEELNAQYAFDANYLNCTVEHMEEMMPFGELPQKLIVQVRRSFVAIRTFVQALRYGSDILKTIIELPTSTTCENRLHSLSYCYGCINGHHSTANNVNVICQSTCMNFLEKCCLQCHNNLNKEWNKYLNDMIRLASRLKTSFNIEHIVSPIHIQISDAIMNFQENGRTISQRLFNKCGRPVHRKREKRNDNPVLNQPYNNHHHHHYHHQQQQHRMQLPSSLSQQQQQQQLQQQQNIDSIIDSMTNDFKTFKNFWSNLPRKLCSYYSTSANCVANQTLRNSDEPNYRDRNNVEIINQQISTLRLISFNLNKAYNGLDVDFENNFDTDNDAPIDDEISDDGSGESSGDDDGSGFIDSSSIDEHEHNKNPIYQHNDPRTNQSSSNNDIHFDSTESTTPITTTTTTTTTKIITLDITKTAGSLGHNNRPNYNSQILIIISSTLLTFWLYQ